MRNTKRNKGAARSACWIIADCMVQGNTELIYRAIENIVRNAIRYTRQESVVELKHYVAKNVPGCAWSTLDVSDCGPGLPEAELENIFRPFYRRRRCATAGHRGLWRRPGDRGPCGAPASRGSPGAKPPGRRPERQP